MIAQKVDNVPNAPVSAVDAALSEAVCTSVTIGAYAIPVYSSKFVGRYGCLVLGITRFPVCITCSPVTVTPLYVNVILAVVKSSYVPWPLVKRWQCVESVYSVTGTLE